MRATSSRKRLWLAKFVNCLQSNVEYDIRFNWNAQHCSFSFAVAFKEKNIRLSRRETQAGFDEFLFQKII